MSPLRPTSRLFVLLVALGLFAACTAPDQDPFYFPPNPLPEGEPGDIIRSRTSLFSLDPINMTPVPGIDAWQILYRSENALSEPNAVSGTVLVPQAPWLGFGSRPLVSWAVGTRGVGDQCAPSYTLSTGGDYEGFFIETMLIAGYAVVVSDYEGLGTPGRHTYVVGQSEGRAVLDAARAAQRLPGTGLDANTRVALMGYSQGGGGAAWAAELAPSYAPELDIRAVAAGGVPADLTDVADFLDGSPFSAFALLAALGLDAAYPELQLGDYLNEVGVQLFAESDDLCLVDVDSFDTIFSTLFSTRDDYTHTDPLGAPDWQARLADNRLGQAAPDAPVFLYQGVVDEIIPFGQAKDLRDEWCDQGANVTWSVLPAEHVTGMVEGLPLAVTYVNNRMAGLPTFGNCWLP